MSHHATDWAIQQRGMRPAAKIVLWHLCDRYHPDHGCFPSQDTLAADCELSRSALNDNLALLEEAGLIRREQRRDGRTNRQKSTFYRFAFEADFNEKPSPEIGHGNEGDSVSGNAPEPCPENGESRVRNSDTNPVIEPVIEPVNEREGASASEESRKDIERKFWALMKDWPGFAGMPKERAKAEWFKLTADERRMAIERRDGWLALLRSQGKSHVPAPSTYFSEKLFAEAPEASGQLAQPVLHKPFSRGWMAKRLALLLGPMTDRIPRPTAFIQQIIDQGGERGEDERRKHQARHGWPSVNSMDARMVGTTVRPDLVALSAGFEKVHVSSALFEAWKQCHDGRGWPWLPDYGTHEWFYFPGGGPDALGEFEAAITAKSEAAE